MIRRRHVYHVAGYDPIDAGSQYRRFCNEFVTFARTWNVHGSLQDFKRSPQDSSARWDVVASASNWHVETKCEHLLWDDVVRADLARPMTSRIAKSILAFCDFVGSGTAFRYLRASWKYGLFFFYPYLLLCAIAVASVMAGTLLADVVELAGVAWVLMSAAASIVIFVGLLRWPGRRMRMLHALDDWIFSRDFVHGWRPDLEARLDQFAEALVVKAREAALDEIVIVGHSMGASLAVEIVARALARDPEFGRHGPTVCVLTVGSTIPKFTLHPAAESMRRAAAAVAAAPSIAWAEYQARDDAISFYKFDPVTASHVGSMRLDNKPMIRRVQIHDMLETRTFWRSRVKFMRLHYQFVLANERRAIYDYFMTVCGPLALEHTVLAPGGAAGMIAMDGALIEQRLPAPALAA
jgi:hypothetical protein